MTNPLAADITTLGPRQRAVLAGLAAGLRTREIAASMFVSVKTVESHIAQIRERYELPHMHATIVFACRVLPQREVPI
jgi:DNA-binding NarL/FixJ family response regulator